jgi:hypothetical protein
LLLEGALSSRHPCSSTLPGDFWRKHSSSTIDKRGEIVRKKKPAKCRFCSFVATPEMAVGDWKEWDPIDILSAHVFGEHEKEDQAIDNFLGKPDEEDDSK